MAETPETLAKTHIMLGNPGYPVLMVDAENDFTFVIVHHWNAGVRVGDRMLIGRDFDTCWTYTVLANQPYNDYQIRAGYRARMIRASREQGVAGLLK